jgi:hypothetical protein
METQYRLNYDMLNYDNTSYRHVDRVVGEQERREFEQGLPMWLHIKNYTCVEEPLQSTKE